MDKLEDRVRAYLGLPPHNKPSNFVIGDYWYLESLRKEYGDKAVDNILNKLERSM